MAISRSLRFQVLRRDGHRCRYCGGAAPDVRLTLDHVVPTTLGGKDVPENLVTACDSCNGGKSATPPDAEIVANIADDAMRWAAAVKAAAGDMLARIDEREADREQFLNTWEAWGRGEGVARTVIPLPDDWKQTVDRFRAAGLPLGVILDAIPKAMHKNPIADSSRFTYLCGVLWNKIRELHEAAHIIVNSGDNEGEEDHTEEMLNAWSRLDWILWRVISMFPEPTIKKCRDEAIDDIQNAGDPVTESEILFNTVRVLARHSAEVTGEAVD